MEQVVYGDVLFIINFSMDFLSLYITAQFIHLRLRLVPAITAAAIGAAYGVAAVILDGNELISLLISVAVSILMCFIALGKPLLLRHTLIFYAVSLGLGGCMTALYSFAEKITGKRIWNGTEALPEASSNMLPPTVTIPIAAVSVILSLIFNRITSKRKNTCENSVKLKLGDKDVILSVLADSGNLLTEPISGSPVILTEYNKISSLLPQELAPFFEAGDISNLASVPASYAVKVRMIPASGIGGDKMLLGFMPDEVIIGQIQKKACVAVLNDGRSFDSSDALVPAALLE